MTFKSQRSSLFTVFLIVSPLYFCLRSNEFVSHGFECLCLRYYGDLLLRKQSQYVNLEVFLFYLFVTYYIQTAVNLM